MRQVTVTTKQKASGSNFKVLAQSWVLKAHQSAEKTACNGFWLIFKSPGCKATKEKFWINVGFLGVVSTCPTFVAICRSGFNKNHLSPSGSIFGLGFYYIIMYIKQRAGITMGKN